MLLFITAKTYLQGSVARRVLALDISEGAGGLGVGI